MRSMGHEGGILLPDDANDGDLAYVFTDGRWTVYTASVGWLQAKTSPLWTPPAPPTKILNWQIRNVLTADGRVLEVEQKC